MSSFNFPETADIETSSQDYARRFSGEVGKWFLKVQEKAVLKLLGPPRADENLLDVGGGHGQLTEAFIQQGLKVTVLGSDEVCKARIQPFLNNQCSFQVGNILDLPFKDKSFDVVSCFRLLPHVAQWEKLIGELTRVSKKGILVDYPSTRSINAIAPLLFSYKKRLEGNTRPFKCFRESDLIQIFKNNGFSLSARFPEFFLPMVLHRVMKWPKFLNLAEAFFRILGLTALFGSPVILKFVRRETRS